MSLTSYSFVFFAAIVVGLYNIVPAWSRVPLLLAASLGFYAASSVQEVLLLCALTGAAYAAALVVAKRRTPVILTASIVAIILPLVLFKYARFLPFLDYSGGPTGLAVPLGISFFTLQAIGYVIDVHRGRADPVRRLDVVMLYLSFFPKLIAGPIERASDLLPQLQNAFPSLAANVYTGLKIALWGFFCKLVVADNIGAIVDVVLKTPTQQSGASLSIAFALYSFQIYFDFLGYTNIAIGVARCFNVHLNQNFNVPYGATSLKEFWRRWHISLSSWFRDYVYIPLGGNATHGVARAGQIGVVFLLSGVWHGATLNFLAWGGFHGMAYCGEEYVARRVRWTAASTGIGAALRHAGRVLITFCIVTIGWVFFRLSDPSSIRVALQRMALLDLEVSFTSLDPIFARADVHWFVVILLSAIVMDSTRAFKSALTRVPSSPTHVMGEMAFVNWAAVTLVLLGDLGVRDFTYMSF